MQTVSLSIFIQDSAIITIKYKYMEKTLLTVKLVLKH